HERAGRHPGRLPAHRRCADGFFAAPRATLQAARPYAAPALQEGAERSSAAGGHPQEEAPRRSALPALAHTSSGAARTRFWRAAVPARARLRACALHRRPVPGAPARTPGLLRRNGMDIDDAGTVDAGPSGRARNTRAKTPASGPRVE